MGCTIGCLRDPKDSSPALKLVAIPAYAGGGRAEPVTTAEVVLELSPVSSLKAILPEPGPVLDPEPVPTDDVFPPLPSGWSCEKHGIGRHAVFCSYRVASEGQSGNNLVETLARAVANAGISCFLDRDCLNDCESWETGLRNGLEGASLIIPLVSRVALSGMVANAGSRRDNLLMEWEIGLQRHADGLSLLLPLFISSSEEDCISFVEDSYPSIPHALTQVDVRKTIWGVLKLQGVKVKVGCASDIESAVVHIKEILASEKNHVQRARKLRLFHEEHDRIERTWRRVKSIVLKGDVIGKGASSSVYRGQLVDDDPDEPEVAVKTLTSVGVGRQFRNELEILKRLQHRNVLRLKDYFSGRALDTDSGVPGGRAELAHVLVLAYCPSGSLQTQLFGVGASGLPDWRVRLRIGAGIAAGLAYCHKMRVFHRDVKPDNVLLSRNMEPRLADFGVSKLAAGTGDVTGNVTGNVIDDVTSYTTVHDVFTPGYDAPELRQARTYGPKSDVYAAGIILLQLATGKPAYLMPHASGGLPVPLRSFVRSLVPPDADAEPGAGRPPPPAASWVGPLEDHRCSWPAEPLAGLLRLGLQCADDSRHARPTADEARLQLEELLQPSGGPSHFGRRPDLLVAEAALSCRVCDDAPRATVFLPCQHAVACATCAALLLGEPCPLCRARVDSSRAAHGPVTVTYQGGGDDLEIPSPPCAAIHVAAGEGLQAALAAAPPGSTVVLLPGVHVGPALITQELHMYGYGQASVSVVEGTAVAFALGAGTKATMDGVHVLVGDGSSSNGEGVIHASLDISGGGIVHVSSCKIVNLVGGPCLLTSGVEALNVESCSIKGSGDGIIIRGGAGCVQYCTVECARDGVTVRGGSTAVTALTLTGGRTGLHVEDNATSKLSGNTVVNASLAGLIIRAGADPDIADNKFVSCGSGIRVLFFGHGKIHGNTIESAGGVGIDADGGSDPVIGPRNVVSGSLEAGIRISGKCRVEGNVISCSGGAQICVASGGVPTITGNNAKDGLSHGILVEKGAKGRLDSNELFGNAGHGILVTNGVGGRTFRSLTVLEGNRCTRNRGCGLKIARESCMELAMVPQQANALWDNESSDLIDDRLPLLPKKSELKLGLPVPLTHVGAPGDLFGHTLALSTSALVVGAPGGASGAAYVFEAASPWALVATLKMSAPGGSSNDSFGAAVAADGDAIIVGAPDRNSAVLFTRTAVDGSVHWRQTCALQPEGALWGKDISYGCSVSLLWSKRLVLVGGYERWGHGGYGMLYRMADDGGLQLIQTFERGEHAAALGWTVALAAGPASRTWAFCGSPADNFYYQEKAGTLFPYLNEGDVLAAWNLHGSPGEWKVHSPGKPSFRANFGFAVAPSSVDGSRAAVAAPGMNGQAGAVHLIQLGGGEHWAATLHPDGLSSPSRFGSALACLSGAKGSEILAIGAPGQPRNRFGLDEAATTTTTPGAVYIYFRSPAEEDTGDEPEHGLAVALPAPDAAGDDGCFGAAIALLPGLLAVGCPGTRSWSKQPQPSMVVPFPTSSVLGAVFLYPVICTG